LSSPSPSGKIQQKTRTTTTIKSNDEHSISLKPLLKIAQNKGFEIEQDKDYGAGPIDMVVNIEIHPADSNCDTGIAVTIKTRQ
jgi:hypothetical protein